VPWLQPRGSAGGDARLACPLCNRDVAFKFLHGLRVPHHTGRARPLIPTSNGAASPREWDDKTEVPGRAGEAHRRWPAGLAMREACKAKVVPQSKPPPSRENRFLEGGAPSPPMIPARSAALSSDKGAAAPHGSGTTRRSSLQFGFDGRCRANGLGEHARPRASRHAPSRADSKKMRPKAGRYSTSRARGAPDSARGGRAPRDRRCRAILGGDDRPRSSGKA
jgi:hypothetical protein